MPNRGALNWSSSNTTKSVSAGYYSGGTLDSRPSYNSGRTQGQNDVKNNPNGYGLYSKTQYDQNYNNGYNAGKAAAKVTIIDCGRYEITQNSSKSIDVKSKVSNYASLTVNNFYLKLIKARELDWSASTWGENNYSQSYSNGVYVLSHTGNWSSSHNFNINITFNLYAIY